MKTGRRMLSVAVIALIGVQTLGVLEAQASDPFISAPAPNVTMHMASITMQAAGGGQAFDVRDPYIGIYHIIALVGTYPSRP